MVDLCDPFAMVSVEAMEGVFERLLADEETMDVEIEMLDGKMQAHANVLSANSEAIKGIFRHSVPSATTTAGVARKKLSWREHSVEVGRFFLRLLYTGTVLEEETWLSTGEIGNTEEREVPLRLLLGAVAIATTYQVPHLVHALTEALKRRISDSSFNEICSAAIRLDVTALRLCCLRYAEEPPLEFKEGARVRATRSINVDCALVKENSMGTVSPDSNRINWDSRFITRASQVRDMVEVVTCHNASNAVHEMYTTKTLSPEVMSELSALWGSVESPAKRRRTL